MKILVSILAWILSAPPQNLSASLSKIDQEKANKLVAAMKRNPRGPYERVAWFCKDGSILAPKSYACKDRGGGLQYGVLSPQANMLASLGIYVGTVLAPLSGRDFFADNYYRTRAYVIEKHLERSLDGWVLKSAKSYRGFRQAEDEEKASWRILEEMAAQDDFIHKQRFLAVRLIRALPLMADSTLADEIRSLATTISDADAAFMPTRFKIHSYLDPQDAMAVRALIPTLGEENQLKAKELASKIDAYYHPQRNLERLQRAERLVQDQQVKKAFKSLMSIDRQNVLPFVREVVSLIDACDHALHTQNHKQQVALLYTMKLAKDLLVDTTLSLHTSKFSRKNAMILTEQLLVAARGLGVLSQREFESATVDIHVMLANTNSRDYFQALDHLSRVVEWSRARAIANLGIPLARYRAVEPRADTVIDHVLRSGVMLPLGILLDRLIQDFDRLRGSGHDLRGIQFNAAIQGENPGFAVGPLTFRGPGASAADLLRHEIVVLHDLPPEMPPVAGIITVGSAGRLSHVSLLAQNLGIPQLIVNQESAEAMQVWEGKNVVMGVSVGRRVVLGLLSSFSEHERSLFERQKAKDKPFLKIESQRLDLQSRKPMWLSELSEKDAGVRVGPKAAQLAKLKKLFPKRVSDAIVLPFGSFVQHVNRSGAKGEPSPLGRLQKAYHSASNLAEAEKKRLILPELERFRTAIQTLPFSPGFVEQLEKALDRLGQPETFGVFVRSDTNVEDLKEFTGAGLNLSVPNQVRHESILAAIRAVWASPFSQRSYAWRQRILLDPEHVYPSVVLHKTVPCDVSGVMLTTNIESGAHDAITISTSEGVAAVVDGGLPETLVVRNKGNPRLISSCHTALRRVIPPLPQEGVIMVPALGREPLLESEEIRQLWEVVAHLRQRLGPHDKNTLWDIEFGFVDRHLYLMQLRPLKPSRLAVAHPFLTQLDTNAAFPEAAVTITKEVQP